jgi:hypothetical protein
MTPDEAVSEYHRVIAEYDRLHAPCPIERRQRHREAERQQRREHEARKAENQALTQAQWHAWFLEELNAAFLDKENCFFIESVGGALGETCQKLRKEYEPKIAALETRIKELEQQQSLEAKFFEMERRLDARQLARDQANRESQMIPQSNLLAEIEKLRRHVDDLMVADQDAPFRELADRVGELEKTNSLEARFTKLAHEVKSGSEIPQGELLEKFEALRRQLDDPKKVSDLDARYRELAERVGELEKTNSLETRFNELAKEVKHGTQIQSELLARIDGLQRQIDDLKKVANQSGPQGPPGKDGKLPIVKVFQKDTVYYTGDVVICDGSTYQALRDTGQNVNHVDWICLARAGRNGSDGRSPNVRGAYDAREKYEWLDVVALDGAGFIARHDNPGICPGDGWQASSRQGRPGRPGEAGERGPRGEKGEKGEPGATVVSWQLDRQRYRISPLMSDGKVGPILELRGLFEQFLSETS